MTDYSEKWGVIAEHGKKDEDTEMYTYPWNYETDKEYAHSKRYRIVWPEEPVVEDNKGNIFEIIGDIKHPYVELCDKYDRPEAMGV